MRPLSRSQLLLTALIIVFVASLAATGTTNVQAHSSLYRALKNTPTPTPESADSTPDPRFIDSGPINDGDSVTGDIDNDHLYYVYTYEGKANDTLTLDVTTKGGLVPYVAVSTSDQKDILKKASAGKAEKTVQLIATLPEDGSYLVIAGRVDGAKGTTKGSFTMTLAISTGGDSTTGLAPIDPTGDPSDVVDRLQQAGLVPEGGKQLISIASSFGQTSDPNSSFLRMGRGAQAQDMVMSFVVGWNPAGDTSACGMAFRITPKGDYSTVMLSNDSHIITYQTEGDKTIYSFDQEAKLNDFDKLDNIITVIAIKDQVTLFVNGQFVTQQTAKTSKGVFAIQVFNPKKNKVVTYCEYSDIWVWAYN